MTKIGEFTALIEDLKERVTKSQNLANEVADFIENLEKRLDEADTEIIRMEMEIADIIQRILDDEPDIKLRSKFRGLVEIIRRENGNITANKIAIKILSY